MRTEPISKIMTPFAEMAYVEPETSIERCISMMKEHGLRHLPVLEDPLGAHKIKGVISLKDIFVIVQSGYICPRCWAAEDAMSQGAPSAGTL